MYTIVHFPLTRDVEGIPDSWVQPDGNHCVWPQLPPNNSVLQRMIRNCEPVKKGTLWEIEVHGHASSFAEKEKMVADLMRLSDIENSSIMEKGVKKRKLEFKPKITSTQKVKHQKKFTTSFNSQEMSQSLLRPLPFVPRSVPESEDEEEPDASTFAVTPHKASHNDGFSGTALSQDVDTIVDQLSQKILGVDQNVKNLQGASQTMFDLFTKEFGKLRHICAQSANQQQHIREDLKLMRNSCIKDVSAVPVEEEDMENYPLTNAEELQQLEESLSVEDAQKKLVSRRFCFIEEISVNLILIYAHMFHFN